MTLPDPADKRGVPRIQRPVVFAAVIGGGVALWAAIVGLVFLGLDSETTAEVAVTGVATIGATLAGGFAGWLGRAGTASGRREGED